MYHPPSEADSEEYLELKNVGATSVNLHEWEFTRGISYTFPDITLEAGDYLVVAADTSAFQSTYGVAGALGNWTGSLSNRGERLTLVDASGDEVHDITYSDQGDWATRIRNTNTDVTLGEDGWVWHAEHDGAGSSLELTNTSLPSATDEGVLWKSSTGGPTPGSANSTATSAFAPVITKVKHAPAVPSSSDTVTISARVVDVPSTSISVDLRHRESTSSPGSFQTTAMSLVSENTYAATLPAMAEGTLIEFYVEATDGTLSRTWPPPTDQGQIANALYQVDNEVHDSSLPFYRLLMTIPDETDYDSFNRDSNALVNSTLIAYDCQDTKIRYQCGTRIRGKASRHRSPRPMRIELPRDRPIDGTTEMNLNMLESHVQVFGQKLFQAAGMASVKAWQVQIRRNGVDLLGDPDDERNYGYWVHLQVMNGNYPGEVFPQDAGGNLYKGGRFNYRSDQDYQNQSWTKRSNKSARDYSDLHGIIDVLVNQVGSAAYLEQVESVIDLDQWLRWFGIMSLLANSETNLSTGDSNDYAAYVGETDPRMRLLPHDLDSIITRSGHPPESFTLFDMIEEDAAIEVLIDLFAAPTVETRYYEALRDLLETTFAKSNFDDLLTQVLGDWLPASELNDMITWMDARRAFATAEVETALGVTLALPVATSASHWETTHTGDLVINEVLAAADSVTIDGIPTDYIELANRGSSAINLSGSYLTDNLTDPTAFTFPEDTIIPPGGFLLVLATDQVGDGLRSGFQLDADGESVSLFAADGTTLIDHIAFGCQIVDHSIGRNASDHWTLNVPTPTASNSDASLGDVNTLRINEWLTTTDTLYREDHVELYNPSATPLALGGVALQRDAWTGTDALLFPPLSFLGNASFKAFAHKLDANYGWLSLVGDNGVEIDEVHWECQQPDISAGRATDGGVGQTSFTLPTIGRSNADTMVDLLQLQDGLRVVKLHFDPAEGTAYEYIEIKNVSLHPLDISKVRFASGIDFRFPNLTLAPGESAILAEDQVQYETYHGKSTPLIGQYAGKLSNDGETLRLEVGPHGFVIQEFRYEDTWYPSTDGGGDHLQVVDETAAREAWNTAAQWSPSTVSVTDPYALWIQSNFNTLEAATAGRLADPDSDQLPNLLEWAIGLDPTSHGESGLLEMISSDATHATFRFSKNLDASGLTYRLQESDDLTSWQDSTITENISTGLAGDLDQREVTIERTNGARLFYRIEVQTTP